MTTLNILLCLPQLDFTALTQKRSVVAVVKRFIVPDRSFALLPCRSDLVESSSYHPSVASDLESLVASRSTQMEVTHWAQCVFCQSVDEGAIATLSKLTIWTAANLSQQLQDGSLFLAFLRTYALPKPFTVESEPVCEQIYKFLPLPSYLDVKAESPVYSSEEFSAEKRKILAWEISEVLAVENSGKVDEEVFPKKDVSNSSDCVTQIVSVGNSSDGHTFEKLIRKALIELGFSNSAEQSAANLNPNATGGASGLDFYANQPYKIVGECKASKHQKIYSDAATQLVRLGLQNLASDEYLGCVKIVVAAGTIAAPVNKIAEGHRINVLRPRTISRLIEIKTDLQDYFDLMELKIYLEDKPFGEEADSSVNKYLDSLLSRWSERQEYIQLSNQMIKSLEELSDQVLSMPSQAFSIAEICAHHNAKYKPLITAFKAKGILEQHFYKQNSPVRKRYDRTDMVSYFLIQGKVQGTILSS